MVDSFLRSYTSIKDRNPLLKKIKFYSFQRFLISTLANIILPVWFQLDNFLKRSSTGISAKNEERKIIVSLTTFPARIERVWLVIECILRQKHQPDRIILWLSKEQFQGLSSLPKSLLKLQNKGLEIVFCDEDLRSHKKYYYSIKRFPKDILITVDDDLFYPSDLINKLVDLHKKYPTAICCDRALGIAKEGKQLLPYKKWDYLYNGKGPSFDLFQTSGGGTLYPPGAFSEEVLNKDVFMKLCRHADDVWLNLMSQMNNTQTIKTNSESLLISIFYLNNVSLKSVNVYDGQNDIQIENVRNYFKFKKNSDPLSNLFDSK